jgi:hypothetical protein
MTKPTDEKSYWLDEPRNVDKVYYAVLAICLALFVADAFYEKKVHFAFEGWFGFFGLYGLIACVGLVLAAKELRKLLKRDENYYDR